MRNRTTILCIGFLLAWCVAQGFIIYFETRFPGPDIFQFKLPGVELATRGTLTSVNMPNSAVDTREVYAFYPPLFPTIYGVWVKCFGNHYGTSVLFDSLWRLARALVILLWISRLVGKSTFENSTKLSAVFLFLWISTWLPNNEDRPDEMGFVLALTSLYVTEVLERGGWLSGAVLGGVLLGLAAAVSPTAGLFAAVLHVFWWIRRNPRRLVVIGLVSLGVFGLVIAPVLWVDPTALERFLIGVKYNALPYANRSEHARMGTSGVASFLFHLKQSVMMGAPFFLCLGILIGLNAWWYAVKVSHQMELLICAIVCAALSIIVFSIEPLYLWFSCCLLMIVLLSKIILVRSKLTALLMICGLVASISLMLGREGKLCFDGITRVDSQGLSAVRVLLKPYTDRGARLVIGADSFFSVPTGAGDNLDFVCRSVHTHYDYAWISESQTFQVFSKRAEALPRSGMCYWTPSCYELVADHRSVQRFKIFGWESPYYVRGFGGILYRNTCKATGIFPPA